MKKLIRGVSKMRILTVAILTTSMLFAGCADLDTVSRRSPLPNDDGKSGTAIHLDAKQRVVIAKSFGTVCAEPSPDALSAFASSLGASASIPGTGAASLSQAFQSTVGSIGLRTQSITLMRDALYRICEAYYGRALTGPAVATLLAQSQYLTAAILAMEQLTGPAVAKQVILSSEARSRASASIMQTQAQLDAARTAEEKKRADLETAETDLATANSNLQSAQDAVEEQQAVVDGEKVDGELPDEKRELQTELEKRQSIATANLNARDEAQETRDKAAKAHQEAQENVEQIERNRDAILVQSAAAASGDGEFSTSETLVKLDPAASKQVAESVQAIAIAAINRSYVIEACIALITDNPPRRSAFVKQNKKESEGKLNEEEIDEQAYEASFRAWSVARDACLNIIAKKATQKASL